VCEYIFYQDLFNFLRGIYSALFIDSHIESGFITVYW